MKVRKLVTFQIGNDIIWQEEFYCHKKEYSKLKKRAIKKFIEEKAIKISVQLIDRKKIERNLNNRC